MRKQEFLEALRAGLSGLPRDDVEDRLAFYSEMIDDRVEDGRTEEEAVGEIGSMEQIVSQIIADIPLTKIAKERIKPNKRLAAWEIVLLAVGSPLWLSLAVAALAIVLSLYAVLWSVVLSVWAVFVALSASALGTVAGGIVLTATGHPLVGLALMGAGLVCGGLAILAFLGCPATTKGTAWLTKTIALGVKKCLIKKEESR